MRPFRRAGRGREGRERLRVSSGVPGGVEWPSWRAGRGMEALLEGWEGSGGHPKGQGGIRSLTQCAERESEGPPRGLVGARRGW